MRIGVVDVGTNSVRVLLCDTEPWHEIARELVITRLGEGVDRSGALAPAALARTVDAIAAYVERCRAARATHIRVIATSAVRDASDRDRFLEAVRTAAGITPDVLPGEEEARLGFAGAIAEVRIPGPYLVCDIGGGSTELVYGSDRAEQFISLDVGSVRLTERHLRSDPPSAAEVDALRTTARAHLDRAAPVTERARDAIFVGLAGTITTMAAIALGVDRYDRARIHGANISRAQIASVCARLLAMNSAQRAMLPVMPRGREDVIAGGALILEEVMDRCGALDVVVSESDILDGTARKIASQEAFSDPD